MLSFCVEVGGFGPLWLASPTTVAVLWHLLVPCALWGQAREPLTALLLRPVGQKISSTEQLIHPSSMAGEQLLLLTSTAHLSTSFSFLSFSLNSLGLLCQPLVLVKRTAAVCQ